MENEIWKDVIRYEGSYQVSNFGRVKSLGAGETWNSSSRILKNAIRQSGYSQIDLCNDGRKKSYKISRLVAQAFISNPENKPQVNHINGIKNDDRMENLEWVNGKENMQHAWSTGLKKPLKGNQCSWSKLTEKQVRVIKHCINLGMTDKEISKYFYNNQSIISSIRYKKSWTHIKI